MRACVARAQPSALLKEQRALGDEHARSASEPKERKKMRGRSKLSMKLKKKRKNVIDAEKKKLIEKLEADKKRRRVDAGAERATDTPAALRRFGGS